MIKKRIIIDMDDVLADASTKILNIFNSLNGTNFNKEFFEDKSFYEFTGQSQYKSYIDSIHEPGFFVDLSVITNAIEVVKELNETHNVYVVSAATEFPNSLKEKYDWMQKYFPFISWRNFVLCGDKSIINGDVMIDDHVKNLVTFKGETLLFNAMHNYTITGYNRVDTWLDIHNYFFK
jgi:5'-nucleotidase